MYFGSEFEAPVGRGLWESEEDIRQTAGVPARSLAHRLCQRVQTRSRPPPELHLVATCSLPGGWAGTDRRGIRGKKVGGKWSEGLTTAGAARRSGMRQKWKVAGRVWRSRFTKKEEKKPQQS